MHIEIHLLLVSFYGQHIDEFQCAPLKTGASIETCRLTSHVPTTWFIGVHGKMDSDYQLKVKTDDLKLISQINVY